MSQKYGVRKIKHMWRLWLPLAKEGCNVHSCYRDDASFRCRGSYKRSWQRQLRRKPKYTQANDFTEDSHSTTSPIIRQDIAHLESQYSWAQIRLAAYSQGSRPSAQVPEDSRTRNGC